MSRIRVAVASGDRLFAQGLRRIIASDPSLDLVGEQEQARLDGPISKAPPDVVLLDSRMPEAPRLGLRLKETGSRIILLAAEADDEWAAEALKAGAHGILGKNTKPGHLMKAIRVVHEGHLWARRQVLEARIVRAAPAEPGRTDQAFLEHRLSAREKMVLRQAASGLTNKEIAEHLAVCQATVKAHLTRIYQKLGLRRRSQLAAAYHGIVPPVPSRPSKPGQ